MAYSLSQLHGFATLRQLVPSSCDWRRLARAAAIGGGSREQLRLAAARESQEVASTVHDSPAADVDGDLDGAWLSRRVCRRNVTILFGQWKGDEGGRLLLLLGRNDLWAEAGRL